MRPERSIAGSRAIMIVASKDYIFHSYQKRLPDRRFAAVPLEIERKFLVADDGWKKYVVRDSNIRDGLIANNDGHKARVRIADDKATITLKSRRMGLVRTEFEYAIPYADAEEILRTMCDGNVLNKVRHFVVHKNDTWEVDVYDDILKGIFWPKLNSRSLIKTCKFPIGLARKLRATQGTEN
jgi:adenylate cyclase